MYKDHFESLIQYDEVKARIYGEHLHKKYPGHGWAVNVNGGVANVFNLMFDGNWGFRIKVDDIDSHLVAITKAGGELLERYNLPRGRAKECEYRNMARDFAGRPVGDKS